MTVFVSLAWTLSANAQNSAPPDILKEMFSGQPQLVMLEAQEEQKPLTLEEIVNPLITSASRSSESSLTAPAWVITLTGDELRKRGYIELSQVLDDLPGIDVVRPWGASWLRPYWRGKRNVWGESFLFMVDGFEWHDAIYNNARMMVPLSNVERIEVVYGPGSLMFGPNAMMGTVNVITKMDSKEFGTSSSGSHGVRAPQSMLGEPDTFRYLSDFTILHKAEDFRVRLTTRFENGYIDESAANHYEWFNDNYYAEGVWGEDVIESLPGVGEQFRSGFSDRSFDFRFATDKLEVGVQHFEHRRGTGMQFVGDRYHNGALWHDMFSGAHIKYETGKDALHSTFKARYKLSRWPETNTLLSRTPAGVDTDGAEDSIVLRQYEAFNESLEIDEMVTFDIPQLAGDTSLRISGGVNYSVSDLSSDFVKTEYQFEPNSSSEWSDESTYVEQDYTKLARGQNKSVAGYFLLKFNINENQFLDFGARQTYFDFLDEPMLAYRVAYVAKFWEAWTVKFMAGKSYSLPTMRQMSFSASSVDPNPDLNAELSTTFEAGLNFNSESINIQLNPYWVFNENVIALTDGQYTNSPDESIMGVDLAIVASLPGFGMNDLKVWSYVTWHPWMLQRPNDGSGREEGSGTGTCKMSDLGYMQEALKGNLRQHRECFIGDIAQLKIKAGVTAAPFPKVSITALARAASRRYTVSTNPKATINPYVELDATAMLQDVLFDDVHLTLTVSNLLNNRFTHPGIASATGGVPATLDSSELEASSGGYSSRLPQPGRAFQIMVVSEFD